MLSFFRKSQTVAAWIGAAVLTALRGLMILFGEEADTGYTSSSAFLIALIAAGALLLVWELIPALSRAGKKPLRRPKGIRGFYLLLGAAFAARCADAVRELLTGIAGSAGPYSVRIPVLPFFELILSVLGVCFFLLLFLGGGTLQSRGAVLLAIGPVGIYMIRLVEEFMNLTMNPAVPAYALMIISVGFSLLLLVRFGRLLLEGSAGLEFRTIAALCSGALAMTTVWQIVFSLVSAPVFLPQAAVSEVVLDFALLLFSLVAPRLIGEGGEGVPAVPEEGSRRPAPRAARSASRGRYTPRH